MSVRPPYDRTCLAIDVDWAPDELLAFVLERLDGAGVRATIFATHATSVLDGLDPARFELALHPNFERSIDDLEAPLGSLKDAYPDAIGGRSHALFVSSRILETYVKYGLRYEANNFLLLHQGLHPTVRSKDLVSLPSYWSDDKHIELGEAFEVPSMHPAGPGLKIFTFHPIHVFMNTTSDEHYASYKRDYQAPSALRRSIAKGRGIGSLFDLFLAHLTREDQGTHTLADVYREYVSDAGGTPFAEAATRRA